MSELISAVSYLRVSGAGQIEGDGFPRQRAAIERYAAHNNIVVIDEFVDEGISGTTELEGRVGLAACLERIENNGVKLVLVESADRLARDSMIAELIVRQFQKAGGRVISASGSVDLTAGDDSNPTAKLIRQILASVAEFDRCVTVLKLKAARNRIKANGRRKDSPKYSDDPATNKRVEGPKPYGTLPGEEGILTHILDMAAHGAKADVIAQHLNEDDEPTRFNKRWHGGTIQKILDRQRKHPE